MSANAATRARHAILALVLMLVMPGMIGCGDPADRVAAGMSEAQVLDALGQPSSSTTDRQQIAFYIRSDDGCPAKAARVLVYDRWMREDALVALGTDAKVVCVQKAMVVTRH